MKRPVTRRTITKILLAAPAALAAGTLGCQSTAGSGGSAARQSPAEQKHREDLARSVSRLKRSIERLDQLEIAIGGEPAMSFEPLLANK
jgi:hypothetical protein